MTALGVCALQEIQVFEIRQWMEREDIGEVK